jgi:hypothetical protein
MISKNDLVCLKRVLERDHEEHVGTPVEGCRSDDCFQHRVIEWIDSSFLNNTKEEHNE